MQPIIEIDKKCPLLYPNSTYLCIGFPKTAMRIAICLTIKLKAKWQEK